MPYIFHVFVAEMDDNIEQIKKDLHMFLYHLRLPAEVFVVPLVSVTVELMSFVQYCLNVVTVYISTSSSE